MSSRPPPDRATLLQALDHVALLDAEAREAWLDALAARDPDFAARVRALVSGAAAMADLDHGPDFLAGHITDTHATLDPGTRLGAWRVMELIGSGGMGRVYLGERADGAFEKRVAIKVLRRERRLPDSIIEHERALLARLEHPGLTRLLDGGISGDDAWLVMELVEGSSLTQWCTTTPPGLQRRLRAFDQILDAVAHAHRHLVVHGDLKPDNIWMDREGRVRVLDFGVARMLSGPAPTSAAGITPGWTAPECRDGSPPQIAADIYSLGRLLESLVEHCGTRSAKRVPRDLQAIIDRAMADDPDARYATVMGLRVDLQRFHRREPVAARGGGQFYLLGRFLRRHWFGVSVTGAIFALIIAAGGMALWQERQIRSERDAAELAARRSQSVLDYLLGVLGNAQGAESARPRSLRTLLNESLKHIDSDFSTDTVARQSLLTHLGELFLRLNDFSGAHPLLERAVSAADANTPALLRARMLDNFALVQLHRGEFDAASAHLDEALRALRDSRADTRGARAEILVTRAQWQSRRGHLEEAVATLREALSLRLAVSAPESAQTVVVRNSLAIALVRANHLAEALRQFRQISAALQLSHREHSLDAANVYGNHASAAYAYGRYQEAQALFARALELQEDLYGPSAALAALLNNSGRLELALGNLETARTRITRGVAMMARFNGAESIDALLVRSSLGVLARAEGDTEASVRLYSSLIEELTAALGENHPVVVRARAERLLSAADRLAAADAAFDDMLQQLAAAPGLGRVHADLLCERALHATEQALWALAARSAQACLDIRVDQVDPGSPVLLRARIIERLAARARPEAADAALAAQFEELAATLGADHPEVRRLAAVAGV